MIDVRRVTRQFGSVTALDSLSFSVAAGEVVGLLGPNGSGKTTMIRLLCGLLRPDEGRLLVAGVDPLADGHAVRSLSGVLTESAEFYGYLSGRGNLRFFAELYGVQEAGRVEQLLAMFGLEEAADRPVSGYSTGMRKRLGLARALLHRPPLLFLDEPTNGLDPEGTRQVLEALRSLQRSEGTTILICSHLLEQLEAVCDRYLFIRRGALLASGSLPELRNRYRPGVTLEVHTTAQQMPAWDDAPPLTDDGPVSGARGTLRQFSFTLPDVAAVPLLLSRLASEVPVYGARVHEDSLGDVYFRVQEQQP